MRRIWKPFVVVLAAIYFVADALFATIAHPLSRWLSQQRLFSRLRTGIRSLRPYPSLALFAQVIDSKDAKAIKAAADKHGITFPVVYAVEKSWDQAYHVKGVSRTIYYAQKNKIVWTATGLDDKSKAQLESQVKKDLSS